MDKAKVVEFFGSQKAMAKKLRTSQPSISKWGDDIPELRKFQIEVLTEGAFKAPRYDDDFDGPSAA